MSDRENQVIQIKKYHSIDYSLLFLTIFMVIFGLVMVYSTSYYNAAKMYNDPTLYLRKQGLFAILGIGMMLLVAFFVSRVGYVFVTKRLPYIRVRLVTLFYALCLGLQILVLVVGEEIKGAKRWLEIPFIGSFQPSEITKVCIIVFTACIAYLAPKRLDYFRGFILAFLRVAPLIVLVALENLSTALIMCGIFVVICFVTSRKKWYYGVCAVVFPLIVAAYIFLGDGFRATRIDAWLNVETHEKGYQILQGLYAIASGGFLGKGLGNSVQKLGFIPESHNDMIFSVICEELGLVGAIAIIMLYLLMLWRLYVIASNAPDLFGSLVVTGIMAHIGVQVILNIAVVTNTIPATGVSLPFVSYGGSALLFLLAEMGVALGISARTGE